MLAICYVALLNQITKTSSATKCKCGREKWEHPKAT